MKKYESWDGTILEWNGYDYYYGMSGLMNRLGCFSVEFQKQVFAKFGLEVK